MHYKNIEEYILWEAERIKLFQESNISLSLRIKKLYISKQQRGQQDYSITQECDTLEINEFGIVGDRHNTGENFIPRLREGHIYPKWVLIRNERHILGISEGMCSKISKKLWVEVWAELLWANILFERENGEEFFFDGLPVGTDFMIYSEDAMSTENKELFIWNLRLSVFQSGCGITGSSIAKRYNNMWLNLSFLQNSYFHRGILLYLHGPKKMVLKKWQKVFLWIPTSYIK